ncbi:hypothetical protein FSP39_014408 [Pinctada imbricata]|uniref:Heat shock 70 kDa protein 12A n=1 Tax=Pinctada imbricata TaxID=66713 RepID=A0AA88YII8_PINIB|nr:hypothetical protein FSP39_014408 [Pinctada imbricata]
MKNPQQQTNGADSTLLVAAIDFGTTYSGFAYGFKDGTTTVKSWHGEGSGLDQLASYKAPTSLLLTPEGSFDSFGYKAEKRYSDLADNDDHEGWKFFKHFKMLLHNRKNLSHDTTLTDDQGEEMPAKTVFAHCIRYMKEDLTKMLSEKKTSVREDEIRWVITVPAIWEEASKQFMREAAKEAGIPSNQLRLALEPEAASVHVKDIPVERSENQRGDTSIQPLQPGSRYMVLDLGGGTVDVTVHEILADRSLRELTKASGGAWGGAKVNTEFLNYIEEIVGKEVMDQMRLESHCGTLDLNSEIEQKKRSLTVDNQNRVVIKLPAVILEMFENRNGVTLAEYIKNSNWGNIVDMHKEKLRIDYGTIAKLFAPSVKSIVSHTEDTLRDPLCENVHDIVLVGGFADSKVIRTTMKAHFSNYRVIIPQEAGLAVLRGAVQFGLQPSLVAERISRFTYGTSLYRYFMEGDPEERKRKIEGQFYCKGVFNKLAGRGDTFSVGQRVETAVNPLTADMTQMPLSFYKTVENPQYTDNSCELIGNMLVDMPNTEGGLDRIVMVYLNFGDTELQAEGVDTTSGKQVSVTLDLLSVK